VFWSVSGYQVRSAAADGPFDVFPGVPVPDEPESGTAATGAAMTTSRQTAMSTPAAASATAPPGTASERAARTM